MSIEFLSTEERGKFLSILGAEIDKYCDAVSNKSKLVFVFDGMDRKFLKFELENLPTSYLKSKNVKIIYTVTDFNDNLLDKTTHFGALVEKAVKLGHMNAKQSKRFVQDYLAKYNKVNLVI